MSRPGLHHVRIDHTYKRNFCGPALRAAGVWITATSYRRIVAFSLRGLISVRFEAKVVQMFTM